MDKLEELKEQRRRINEQIKLLEGECQIFGCAKLDVHNYPRGREYYIAIKSLQADGLQKSRWQPISNSIDKDVAIRSIDTIVRDLQGLKAMLTEDN